MKKSLSFLLSLVLCFALLFSQYATAAVVTFETQNNYDEDDIAWLTGFEIRESMDTVSGMMETATLNAVPDYAYSTTASAFKAEVAKYCEIFTLTENAPRASYIYMFEFLNANSSLFTGDVTDEKVWSYLEDHGVQMPASVNTDNQVLAKALYVAMSTGSFSGYTPEELGKGVAFEKAILRYLVSFSGVSESELLKWLPEGEMTSFDDYILAMSKYTLQKAGYAVTPQTGESETYRLMAVMTLQRNLGVVVDTDASFDELKAKYTAALLGRKYGVSLEADRLSAARSEDDEAFYLLQAIGKKAGLSIRSDMEYEEAFDMVALNSTVFDIESGVWYADVYKYEAILKEKRDTIWLYPTSYLTGQEDAQVTITVNGTPIGNAVFTALKLNTAQKEQDLEIVVRATKNISSTCTYVITVKQGAASGANGSGGSSVLPALPQSSGSIISNILASFGMDSSVSSIVDSIYGSLPAPVKNVLTFIAPTFGDAGTTPATGTETPAGVTAPTAVAADPVTPVPTTAPMASEEIRNSYFVSMLDKLGKMIDYVIYGVNGVDLGSRYQSQAVRHNFITFN